MNAISEAVSIEEVVRIINCSDSVSYSGGTDTREPEEMAGQYAFESVIESGYTDEENIEFHLELLADRGANFDFCTALDNARQRITNGSKS